MTRCRTYVITAAMVALSAARALQAQAATTATELRQTSGDGAAVGATSRLDRVISVRLEDVTIRDAVARIAAIAAKVGVIVTYSPDRLPTDRVVSLVADHITIGGALRDVLDHTGLGVIGLPSGRVSVGPLVAKGRRPEMPVQPGIGTVTGVVTDSESQLGVANALIHVTGSTGTTRTDPGGHYRLVGAPSGTQTIQVNRLGFATASKSAVIPAGAP